MVLDLGSLLWFRCSLAVANQTGSLTDCLKYNFGSLIYPVKNSKTIFSFLSNSQIVEPLQIVPFESITVKKISTVSTIK